MVEAESFYTLYSQDDPVTSDEALTIRILATLSGSFSLIGSSFIILSYIYFREFRHFHMRLIFYLAIADFLSSLSTIFGSQTRENPLVGSLNCKISGAVLEGFLLSSLLWTLCIAHTLDQVIRKNNFRIERMEWVYHLISWGIPLGSVLFLWFTDRFTDAGIWCWISGESYGLFRFIFFYAVVGFVFLYNATVYLLVSFKLRQETPFSLEEKRGEHTIQTTFRWFIVALFVCWLPGTVNRIQNSLDPSHPIFILYCLHATFTPLQGFFNAIIYGFNDELRQNFRELRVRLNCCTSEAEYTSLSIQEEWNSYYRDAMKEYDQPE